MKEYSVGEFRQNMKQALDEAENGVEVVIRRGNTLFVIGGKKTDRGMQEVLSAIENMKVELVSLISKNSIATAINITPEEYPCCAKVNPCRHWEFDMSRSVWKNSISGREKEVTL